MPKMEILRYAFVVVVCCCQCCVYCEILGQELSDKQDEYEPLKEVLYGPLNDAKLVDLPVTLECEGTDGSRIAWFEYATGVANGAVISLGEIVLPDHPNAERYTILHPSANKYDLHINVTVLEDGGKYRCTDVNIPDDRFAQLIMLKSDPVCTTTIPTDGSVVEQRYYTIECTVNYQADSSEIAPTMTWTGPVTDDVVNSITDTTVSSRIGFRPTSSMTGSQFTCTTNFNEDGFNETEDSATNAPTYVYIHTSVPLNVIPSPYVGVSYIRWGRTVCETTADRVYKGYATGSHSSYGDGTDHLCLPETTQWGTVIDGWQQTGSVLYGVEYELDPTGTPFSFENNNGISLQGLGAPCVACLTNRTSHLMIPGNIDCPYGWTREYRGYMATEKHTNTHRSSQVCVDQTPETTTTLTAADEQGAAFSVVEVACSNIGIPSTCVESGELTCVVCTK